MKVRITHLKAPWPHGAKVGDVAEVVAMPAWALGKCVQVEDGTPATVEFTKADEQSKPLDPLQAMRDEASRAFENLRTEHAARMEDVMRHHSAAVSALQQDIADARAETEAERATTADVATKLDEAQTAAVAEQSKVADLTARLSAAEAALAEARAAKADHKPKKGG